MTDFSYGALHFLQSEGGGQLHKSAAGARDMRHNAAVIGSDHPPKVRAIA
jgi:hypothetical protein